MPKINDFALGLLFGIINGVTYTHLFIDYNNVVIPRKKLQDLSYRNLYIDYLKNFEKEL